MVHYKRTKKEHIIYSTLVILTISLKYPEPVRLTVDYMAVMVDIDVFKNTGPK